MRSGTGELSCCWVYGMGFGCRSASSKTAIPISMPNELIPGNESGGKVSGDDDRDNELLTMFIFAANGDGTRR